MVVAAGLVGVGCLARRCRRAWLRILGTILALAAALATVVYCYTVWQVFSTHGMH